MQVRRTLSHALHASLEAALGLLPWIVIAVCIVHGLGQGALRRLRRLLTRSSPALGEVTLGNRSS